MKRRLKRVLSDCDGCMSDYVDIALETIEAMTGDKHGADEIVKWDVLESIGKTHLDADFRAFVERGNWARRMAVIPGAREGVKRLQLLADEFIIVTSPFSATSWVNERNEWLKEHFGIEKKHIVHTSAKHVCSGDVFIEDNVDNLTSWVSHNEVGMGFLIDSPWNKGYHHPRVMRVRDMIEVADVVREMFF